MSSKSLRIYTLEAQRENEAKAQQANTNASSLNECDIASGTKIKGLQSPIDAGALTSQPASSLSWIFHQHSGTPRRT